MKAYRSLSFSHKVDLLLVVTSARSSPTVRQMVRRTTSRVCSTCMFVLAWPNGIRIGVSSDQNTGEISAMSIVSCWSIVESTDNVKIDSLCGLCSLFKFIPREYVGRSTFHCTFFSFFPLSLSVSLPSFVSAVSCARQMSHCFTTPFKIKLVSLVFALIAYAPLNK